MRICATIVAAGVVGFALLSAPPAARAQSSVSAPQPGEAVEVTRRDGTVVRGTLVERAEALVLETRTGRIEIPSRQVHRVQRVKAPAEEQPSPGPEPEPEAKPRPAPASAPDTMPAPKPEADPDAPAPKPEPWATIQLRDGRFAVGRVARDGDGYRIETGLGPVRIRDAQVVSITGTLVDGSIPAPVAHRRPRPARRDGAPRDRSSPTDDEAPEDGTEVVVTLRNGRFVIGRLFRSGVGYRIEGPVGAVPLKRDEVARIVAR